MLREENERLTRVGPGTPCGQLMRSYWQPVALSEELPVGGAPLPVRLLGEDLVLFRDDHGRPGLLDIHCPHRGADLSYGRLEDGGLRCIYHGWLFDIHGSCLDQPGEPGGGEHRGEIRQLAYPCVEKVGVIFAYMGRGDPPLLPNFEFLTLPEDQVFATKLYSECNYLQGNEGNIDLLHVSILHYTDRDVQANTSIGPKGLLSTRGGAPELETTDAELVDTGLRICKLRKVGPDKTYIRSATFILPNLCAVPARQEGGRGYTVNWHVPIDDEQHWKYVLIFNRERPLDKAAVRRERQETDANYHSLLNKSNRYLQDRGSMRSGSYSGIRYIFQAQDLCVTEGAGAIQDRTREHLVASDAPIVASRKLLLKAIQDVEEGRDPANVVRDPAHNGFRIISTYGFLPEGVGWKDYCRRLEAEARG
jgi:phthalate 4,5-dioxygenase oxygenase subunit